MSRPFATLNPRWVRYPTGQRGVAFDCPRGCVDHRVVVPLREGGHEGWARLGDTWGDMTLTPSVNVQLIHEGQLVEHWHGWIRQGQIDPA